MLLFERAAREAAQRCECAFRVAFTTERVGRRAAVRAHIEPNPDVRCLGEEALAVAADVKAWNQQQIGDSRVSGPGEPLHQVGVADASDFRMLEGGVDHIG